MEDKCDKCGTDILMGRCSCGIWYEKGEHPPAVQNIEKALLDFHATGRNIESGDHHKGVCYVFFKGNYEKCMNVVTLIKQLENLMETLPPKP